MLLVFFDKHISMLIRHPSAADSVTDSATDFASLLFWQWNWGGGADRWLEPNLAGIIPTAKTSEFNSVKAFETVTLKKQTQNEDMTKNNVDEFNLDYIPSSEHSWGKAAAHEWTSTSHAGLWTIWPQPTVCKEPWLCVWVICSVALYTVDKYNSAVICKKSWCWTSTGILLLSTNSEHPQKGYWDGDSLQIPRCSPKQLTGLDLQHHGTLERKFWAKGK